MKKENTISAVEAFNTNRMDSVRPDSESPFYDSFRLIADSMSFIPTKLRQETLLAARRGDDGAVKLFLAQSAGAIVRLTKRYFRPGQHPAERDELTMIAVTSVLENIGRFNTAISTIYGQIYGISEHAIADYVSTRDGVPVTLVLNPHYHYIVGLIDEELGSNQRQLTPEEIDSMAEELARETKASKQQLILYILHKNSLNADHVPEGLANAGDTTWRTVQVKLKKEAIEEAVNGLLSGIERYVLEQYFGGLGDTEGKTLEEIGENMGVTGARIGQIKEGAIRHLKHRVETSSRTKKEDPWHSLSLEEVDEGEGYIRFMGDPKSKA